MEDEHWVKAMKEELDQFQKTMSRNLWNYPEKRM